MNQVKFGVDAVGKSRHSILGDSGWSQKQNWTVSSIDVGDILRSNTCNFNGSKVKTCLSYMMKVYGFQ